MGSTEALRAVLQKIQAALKPGGCFLMANHFLLKEDKGRTGFDWDQDYGANTIFDTAASLPGFVAEKAVVTDLYRIDRFRKTEEASRPASAEVVHMPLDSSLEPSVSRYVVWGGAAVRREEVRHRRGWTLPVLTYHRVAPAGPEALRQWRVTPEDFRAQMRFLRANGFRAVSAKELMWLREGNRPVHGRPVMITFDDGYQDFEDHAWPILVEHDFNPEVFLVTDRVGHRADWDAMQGEPAPLMGWASIQRLHKEGVGFGSHLATHRPATSLTSSELRAELVGSRETLEQKLGSKVETVAAPHGLFDERFAPLALEAGYRLGYSCKSRWADLRSPDFFVNRIEVPAQWDLAEFERQVSPG
jgi:peptidoglycan/xylan/chitin deacetylase (PgdA/CDA1 family)